MDVVNLWRVNDFILLGFYNSVKETPRCQPSTKLLFFAPQTPKSLFAIESATSVVLLHRLTESVFAIAAEPVPLPQATLPPEPPKRLLRPRQQILSAGEFVQCASARTDLPAPSGAVASCKGADHLDNSTVPIASALPATLLPPRPYAAIFPLITVCCKSGAATSAAPL